MISPENLRSQASYDADGNIVLGGDDSASQSLEHPHPVPLPRGRGDASNTESEGRLSRMTRKQDDEDQKSDPGDSLSLEGEGWGEGDPIQETANTTTTLLTSLPSSLASKTHSAVLETLNQYSWSWKSLKSTIRSWPAALRTGRTHLWAFLNQPVWVPRTRKEPRKYSRLSLFLFDTVRFGATFACIFVVLFVALNAQSYWEVAKTRISPIQHALETQKLTDSVQKTLVSNLANVPSLTVAGSENNLVAHLPPVGPPENRIIIPKLGLNVPLVTPPFESLLREDWIQVEHDIQEALKGGVVHYPGTARPGQAGNFFVTGHSSYYPWAPGKFKTIFARLHELAIGDEYWVYHGGDKHRYIVREKKEVKPSNVSVLDQPGNRRIGTLMTCTPIGTTLRRLILVADEVDPNTGIRLEVGERESKELPKMRTTVLPI